MKLSGSIAAFWIVFLMIVSVGFLSALSARHRHHQAGRTADRLRLILGSDVRFQRVIVSSSTKARVYLYGRVASDEDLHALRMLVEHEDFPTQPGISVEVDSHLSPNKGAAAKPHRSLFVPLRGLRLLTRAG